MIRARVSPGKSPGAGAKPTSRAGCDFGRSAQRGSTRLRSEAYPRFGGELSRCAKKFLRRSASHSARLETRQDQRLADRTRPRLPPRAPGRGQSRPVPDRSLTRRQRCPACKPPSGIMSSAQGRCCFSLFTVRSLVDSIIGAPKRGWPHAFMGGTPVRLLNRGLPASCIPCRLCRWHR